MKISLAWKNMWFLSIGAMMLLPFIAHAENGNGLSGYEKACLPSPYKATALVAIALAPMLETPGEAWDVKPFRLSLLVGSHRAVYGCDLGVVGNFADYKMNGLAIATLFNAAGESDGVMQISALLPFAAYD